MLSLRSLEVMVKVNEVAIVIPVGPCRELIIDTLDSIACYCPEPHQVILVDDCTQDGTYDVLLSRKQNNWRIIRNSQPMGITRLVHSLCSAYRSVLADTHCDLVLRLDQDALLIKQGIIGDAVKYMLDSPDVGLFGVYEVDYDRPRSFESHRKLMDREAHWIRKLTYRQPYWMPLLHLAEKRGYERGDNVFGGAYFVTRACLEGMKRVGALDVPYRWNSRLMEDVYFSMAAVAGGFELGHFGAPDGPLCLEWRGLPFPARVLHESKYKVIHSVDKGKNTDADANGGRTAREIFKSIRENAAGFQVSR